MVFQSIFDEKQPQIVYGILGDTYVYENEQEITVEENDMNEDGEPSVKEVTKYQYDTRIIPLTDKTESGALAALKSQLTDDITDFDSGLHGEFGDEAVNDFSMGGQHMWLDKETRVGLKLRLDSEKQLGLTQTTLWYGSNSFTLDIDTAQAILVQLEVYASQCYDNTALHKKNVDAITSIHDLFNYDYKSGYPEKLSF